MMLITKEVEKAAKTYPLGSQDGKGEDAVAWLKFFNPVGRYTFYVTEAAQEEYDHGPDWTFYGWCESNLGPDCDEWGYNTLGEIQSVKLPFGMGIERDRHFTPETVAAIKSR